MGVTLDDGNLFDWAFKGIVGLLVTVLSWIVGKQVGETERNRDGLANYKTFVADNYIKKDVADRIHNRIDSVDKKMDEMKDLLITSLHAKK